MLILYTNIHSENQSTFWDTRALILWPTGDNFQLQYSGRRTIGSPNIGSFF